MQKLKCETTTRGLSTETVTIDGGGLLHNIYWQKEGFVQDLINEVMRYTTSTEQDFSRLLTLQKIAEMIHDYSSWMLLLDRMIDISYFRVSL